MIRGPIFNPKTGETMPGQAFDTDTGRLAVHECHNDCAGIIIGQKTAQGTAVIHYTATEALVIGQAIVELAKKALG